MDANGYDTVLEEVNNNWLKAAYEWSYLEATRDGLRQTVKDWNEKYKDIPDSMLTTDVEPGNDIGKMAKAMMAKGEDNFGNPVAALKDYLKKYNPAPPKGTSGLQAYWNEA